MEELDIIFLKKRTNSWCGDSAMAIFSINIDALLGTAGILAGIAPSIIEHFEFD